MWPYKLRMAACSEGGGHFGGHTISHSAGSLASQSIGLKKVMVLNHTGAHDI
jgi:hypothetical protein